MAGIAAGGQDDAGGGAVGPLNLQVCQSLILYGLHDGQQVGFQQGQHHLGLGVAKAAVVLDDLGTLGGQHQAKVQTALEGAALGPHGRQSGQEDGVHADLGHVGSVVGVGSDGAHAAGVEAGVVVSGPLVVHGGHHGPDGGAVGKGQHADLRTGQKLLDHDLVAGVAEGFVLHDGLDGVLRLNQILGDQHALAQRQAVGLDDDGEGGGFQILQRLGGVVEDLVAGGGDAVLLHQVLGEHLAGLDAGGLGIRAEAGDARLVKPVHAAQGQGIVRSHHSEIDIMGLGEVHDGGNVLGTDLRDAHRVLGDAAVAGQGVDGLHAGIFFQFLDNGVLAATAADDQKIHGSPPKNLPEAN